MPRLTGCRARYVGRSDAVTGGVLVVLQAGFMYLPFMQDLFRTAPLSAGQWALATLAGAVVVPVVAIEKFVRRKESASPR